MTRDRIRAGAFALAGLLPWAAVTWQGGFYLVFSFGWTKRAFSGFDSLPGLLLAPHVGTPALETWTFATGLYLAAVVAALLDARGIGDRRVTAGLLFLAGTNVLWFALSVGDQRGILVLPVGTITLLSAAVYEYWTVVERAQ